MIADWEVAKTQGVCAGCGQSLEPRQEYYAALVEGSGQTAQAEAAKEAAGQGKEEKPETSGGFERLDYCEQCWQRESPQAFCFWKTCVPEPAQKKKLLVDDEVLLQFFERLDQASERVKINFRFVLALILMRKRILKYQQTQLRDGQEFWIMGQLRQQTKHEVLNPRLDDAQIEEVSEQLSAILRSEL